LKRDLVLGSIRFFQISIQFVNNFGSAPHDMFHGRTAELTRIKIELKGIKDGLGNESRLSHFA
jgi:hypothetical protein